MSLDGAAARLAIILAIAAITFATRLAGFRLALRRASGAEPGGLPPAVERFLGYVPVAAFAALVAPGVADGGGTLAGRLVAVGAAVIAAVAAGRLWLCIAAGLAAFWMVEGVARLV